MEYVMRPISGTSRRHWSRRPDFLIRSIPWLSAAESIIQWNLYQGVTGSHVRNVEGGIVKCVLEP